MKLLFSSTTVNRCIGKARLMAHWSVANQLLEGTSSSRTIETGVARMTEDLWLALDRQFADFPAMKAAEAASRDEIAAAERTLGCSFPSDYRAFLARYGAGIVGPFPIFGLRPVALMGRDHWSVVANTKEVREESVPEIAQWIVFSEDHGGNPVGFDARGQIWIYDHDFGGEQIIQEDFKAYLRYCLECAM